MDTILGLRVRGDTIIGTGAAFVSLAAISVGLRFWAKRLNRIEVGIDDYSILLALVIYIVTIALVIQSTIVGRQANDPTDYYYTTYLRLVYVYSCFYFTIIALCEISILWLYRRIFVRHSFRIASLALIILSALWWLPATLVEIFFVEPIPSYWEEPLDPGFTIQYPTFWVTMMIIELVTETSILSLPVREIASLRLSTKKKAMMSAIFLLGGFVIITGIIRIIYVYQPNNTDVDLTQGDIWLNIHSGVAILSANMPVYRPLLRYFRSKKKHGAKQQKPSEKRAIKEEPSVSQLHPKDGYKSQNDESQMSDSNGIGRGEISQLSSGNMTKTSNHGNSSQGDRGSQVDMVSSNPSEARQEQRAQQILDAV